VCGGRTVPVSLPLYLFPPLCATGSRFHEVFSRRKSAFLSHPLPLLPTGEGFSLKTCRHSFSSFPFIVVPRSWYPVGSSSPLSDRLSFLTRSVQAFFPFHHLWHSELAFFPFFFCACFGNSLLYWRTIPQFSSRILSSFSNFSVFQRLRSLVVHFFTNRMG